jgi:hypothetical protein
MMTEEELRDLDAQECARLRSQREAEQANEPPDKWDCRCDHAHPPGVRWCDLCEFPVAVVAVTDGDSA